MYYAEKSYKVYMAAIVCCGGLIWAHNVGATEAVSTPTYDLGTVVVTATKTQQEIAKVPASVSVVTAEDIEKKNISSIQEALQFLPGVYIDKKAQGSLMLRGMESKDVLVLVDGVQQNSSYNGIVDFNAIPITSVKRIEVLRGAASSLYGGHAVAGVINIITTGAPEEGTHVTGDLSYGSNNTWTKAVSVNSRINDKWSVGVDYEKRSSDGYKGYFRTAGTKAKKGKTVATADVKQLSNGTYLYGGRGEKEWSHENYGFSVGYHFNEDQTLTYTYRRTNSESSYNNPFTYVRDAQGKPVWIGNVLVAPNKMITLSPKDFLGYDNATKRDTHNLVYRDNASDITARISYVTDKEDGFSSPVIPKTYKDVDWNGAGDYSQHPGKKWTYEVEKTWHDVGKHTISAGASYHSEEMTQKRYNLASWHNKDSIINQYAQDNGKVENIALYLQDEYQFNDEWSLFAGARYDHFKKGDGHYWKGDGTGCTEYDVTSSGQNYNHISPKVALEYKANDRMNYYVSYGESFNPPALVNIYRYGGAGMGNVIPNPALDPETSRTWELGLKRQLSDKDTLDVSLYHVKTRDKVEYTTFYDERTHKAAYKQYINYGTEKRRGIELNYEHTFNDGLTGYVNYSWQTGSIDGPKLANTNKERMSNEADYGVPKHILHTGIAYDKNKWNGFLDMQYVSPRQSPNTPGGEYGASDGYFLVNIGAGYKITPDFTVKVGIDNVLNRDFYDSEATSGRTYTLGVRYEY